MRKNRSVYRLRPINEKTIEELTTPYLWFSRRHGFRDSNDANVKAFIDENDALMKRLREKIGSEQIKEFITKLDCTGICCFTKKLPSKSDRERFPNGRNSLCVEYDADVLYDHFNTSIYAMGECFHDVIYIKDSLKIDDNDEYHILSRIDKNGKLYESLLSLTCDEKGIERLISLLLTRISKRFYRQNEQRIILGGRNIPCFSPDVKGYPIDIPKEAILCVHVYENIKLLFNNTLDIPIKYYCH